MFSKQSATRRTWQETAL